jgi:two-component system, cell cycle sensor histidine kinase and response regulator CckA
MARALRLLHLEDSPRDAAIIHHRLEAEGVACDIILATGKESFETALTQEPFDLIISDYNLPGYDGITALKQAQAAQPDVPVILISGTVGEEQAVTVLQMGATDYLLKAHLERLVPAVHRAIREAEARRTHKEADRALHEREQTLRENDERTNFALLAAQMGVWEIDLATRQLTWSDSMAPLYGLTADKAPKATEHLFELIHPDDRRAMETTITQAMIDERAYVVEFRAVWPDGSVHWLHGRAQVLHNADGNASRLLGVTMDIDERKQLEEQLRQSQKLEAIGQFAGGVAHDFNNVLTVILGFSELHLMQLAPDDPARDDILQIKNAASHAAGLTRQLLAFSRKQILHPKVLDVNALIGGIEPMLRLLIAEHVDLRVSLAAEHGLIKIDPTQVEQILVNLAVNAADAMPRGGTLTMATTNVTLDEHYQQRNLPVTPGNYVLLTVSDTGLGMDEATSRHIFEPFFTTKEVGKGTGLGLATVYGIVSQSGGDISVHSEPGRGTSFKIYLPQVTGASPTEGAERARLVADGTRCCETILLVEDDDGVRLLTRLTLERLGYRVLQAANPKLAVRVASEFDGPIDLMLSDVIMPESDGPPLFGQLVAARPAIRALYMSGYADEAIRHVLLVDGTPFLQKPFTPDALARKVRDVFKAPARGA